jgi:hypothetical protein
MNLLMLLNLQILTQRGKKTYVENWKGLNDEASKLK